MMKKKCLSLIAFLLLSFMVMPLHAQARSECRLSVAEWGMIIVLVKMDFSLVREYGSSMLFPETEDVLADAKKTVAEIAQVDGVGGRVSSVAALLISSGINAGSVFEDIPECRDVKGVDILEKMDIAEKCSGRIYGTAFSELSKREISLSIQSRNNERLEACGWK